MTNTHPTNKPEEREGANPCDHMVSMDKDCRPCNRYFVEGQADLMLSWPMEWFTDRDKDELPLNSKKGFPMVKCKLEIADGSFAGRSFFHWVTFLPKDANGAGISVNFLKHIGEPWEGQFDVKPENWVGKIVRAMVKCEADNQGRKRNAIQWLAEKEEEVPF